jgi:hypothetical protein
MITIPGIALIAVLLILGCPGPGNNTYPQVLYCYPDDGNTDIPINCIVTIIFDRAIDIDSMVDAFVIQPDAPGNCNWSDGNTKLEYTPTQYLQPETIYTVMITTLAKDADGNPLEKSFSWSFTTGDIIDTTAPTVDSVSPVHLATDISIEVNILITFSEPMNTSSVENSFSLSDGSNNVNGSFSWNVNTMTFNSDNNLAYDTWHFVTVATGAMDATGNNMENEFNSSFTTEAAGPCTYSITPTSDFFWSSGGTGSFSVTSSASDCDWTATEGATWITITSGSSGSGDGTVTYSVAENSSSNSRTDTITVDGQSHTVTQAPEPSDILITIGDNDGYGYGATIVPDNSDLPPCIDQQGCIDPERDWIFDNRESSESSATDGSQYTDSELYVPGYPNANFTITFSPVDPSTFMEAQFTLDVSGIQTEIFGASSLSLDDNDYSSYLPQEQQTFGSAVISIPITDSSLFTDGSLTVHFQADFWDATAIDFFQLEVLVQ